MWLPESTSLITVPVLFQFGVDVRIALATNMFALTFMSAGGTFPFLRKQSLDRRRLPILIALTLGGSAIGASLLLIVPERSVPLVVSAAMIGVAIFSTVYRQAGIRESDGHPSAALEQTAYALTFLLGIYGGFFSGGYVTVLTAVYVVFLRVSFLEAIATTKLINIFSSGIATIIFMWHHLVDYHLGFLLALAMFAGALVGAHMAIRLGNQWLRRIFLAVVWILGLKTLFYDVVAQNGALPHASLEIFYDVVVPDAQHPPGKHGVPMPHEVELGPVIASDIVDAIGELVSTGKQTASDC